MSRWWICGFRERGNRGRHRDRYLGGGSRAHGAWSAASVHVPVLVVVNPYPRDLHQANEGRNFCDSLEIQIEIAIEKMRPRALSRRAMCRTDMGVQGTGKSCLAPKTKEHQESSCRPHCGQLQGESADIIPKASSVAEGDDPGLSPMCPSSGGGASELQVLRAYNYTKAVVPAIRRRNLIIDAFFSAHARSVPGTKDPTRPSPLCGQTGCA